jgi:hypothetical protein
MRRSLTVGGSEYPVLWAVTAYSPATLVSQERGGEGRSIQQPPSSLSF